LLQRFKIIEKFIIENSLPNFYYNEHQVHQAIGGLNKPPLEENEIFATSEIKEAKEKKKN